MKAEPGKFYSTSGVQNPKAAALKAAPITAAKGAVDAQSTTSPFFFPLFFGRLGLGLAPPPTRHPHLFSSPWYQPQPGRHN